MTEEPWQVVCECTLIQITGRWISPPATLSYCGPSANLKQRVYSEQLLPNADPQAARGAHCTETHVNHKAVDSAF